MITIIPNHVNDKLFFLLRKRFQYWEQEEDYLSRDKELDEALKFLNQINGLVTLYSCAGHPDELTGRIADIPYITFATTETGVEALRHFFNSLYMQLMLETNNEPDLKLETVFWDWNVVARFAFDVPVEIMEGWHTNIYRLWFKPRQSRDLKIYHQLLPKIAKALIQKQMIG